MEKRGVVGGNGREKTSQGPGFLFFLLVLCPRGQGGRARLVGACKKRKRDTHVRRKKKETQKSESGGCDAGKRRGERFSFLRTIFSFSGRWPLFFLSAEGFAPRPRRPSARRRRRRTPTHTLSVPARAHRPPARAPSPPALSVHGERRARRIVADARTPPRLAALAAPGPPPLVRHAHVGVPGPPAPAGQGGDGGRVHPGAAGAGRRRRRRARARRARALSPAAVPVSVCVWGWGGVSFGG